MYQHPSTVVLVRTLRVELITRFGIGKQSSSRLAHQRLLVFVCLPLPHSTWSGNVCKSACQEDSEMPLISPILLLWHNCCGIWSSSTDLGSVVRSLELYRIPGWGQWLGWCPSSSPVWATPCSGMTAMEGALQVLRMQFPNIPLGVQDDQWSIGSMFIYSARSEREPFGFQPCSSLMFSLHFIRRFPPTIMIPFQASALTPSVDVSNVLGFGLHSGCEKDS